MQMLRLLLPLMLNQILHPIHLSFRFNNFHYALEWTRALLLTSDQYLGNSIIPLRAAKCASAPPTCNYPEVGALTAEVSHVKDTLIGIAD